jgi:oxaloacetate decarboxylase (Na+ extruding) subunit alpha
MNLKEIKEVIQLMNENGLTEIEIEKDGLKIRLRKGAGGAIESYVVPAVPSAPQVSSAPAGGKAPAPAAASGKAPIKSPMVGTYYSAPAPDAAPFVQPGSQVEVGQVICIIEAMKLMNEIKSEVRGKIVEILVHNGDPVEFGQPLFVIE